MKSRKPVRTHTFNNRRYKIFICQERLDGVTDQFKHEYTLSIYADLRTRNGLITAIHESLHAENWLKSEEDVDRVSKEIGTFLWRLGYRFTLKD